MQTDTRTFYKGSPTHTCMWNLIRRITPITVRQQQVLEYVIAYMDDHGYAPSVREVGNHFEFRSTRSPGEHLHELARKAALQITPGIARGIRLNHDHELVQEIMMRRQAEGAVATCQTTGAHGRRARVVLRNVEVWKWPQ